MTDGTILARYTYTGRLSPCRWAWEFLRRNKTFLDEARRLGAEGVPRSPACQGVTLLRPGPGQIAAARWGLLFFPDTSANRFEAEVFWNPAIFSAALKVHIGPRAPGERCEIL